MGRVGLSVPTGQSMKIRRSGSHNARDLLMAACVEQSAEPQLAHVFVVDSQPNMRSSQNKDS